MFVDPTVLVDVMSFTSAMAPRWRSNGVAMELAMISGLAPGKDSETKMAGTSMGGREATGSRVNAAAPASGDAERQQDRRDRPRDEWSGDVHVGSSARMPPSSSDARCCVRRFAMRSNAR